MKLSEVKVLMENRINQLWKEYIDNCRNPEKGKLSLRRYREARQVYKSLIHFEQLNNLNS